MPSVRAIVIGIALLASAGVAWARRRGKTAEERERERRIWLTDHGRILDGTVNDVQEIEVAPGQNGSGEAQLVIYQYDVAGVSYEASQDVTLLRHLIDLHSCRLGLPASIKYDPHNPGNSIVISENWSGLRKMSPDRK